MPIVFAFVATLLMLVGPADVQGQSALPVANVGGSWETTWGGGRAVLDLAQKGAAVTGSYSGTNEGTVQGTLAGNVLTGNWVGTGDKGAFVLTFSADGKSFQGTWGMDRSKTDGGPWTGTRK